MTVLYGPIASTLNAALSILHSMKALIFDMNGVIVDDEPIHEQAAKAVLAQYGVTLSHEDYLRHCFGRTDGDGFHDIQKKYGLVIPLAELLGKQAMMYRRLAQNLPPVEGVCNFIKKAHANFRLAIASGAIREEIDFTLSSFHLTRYFPVIVSAEDVRHGKPDPEPYLLAAERLRILPSQCTVIEDSAAGILAAKKAGMICIGFRPVRSTQDVHKADKIITSFSDDVLEWLTHQRT